MADDRTLCNARAAWLPHEPRGRAQSVNGPIKGASFDDIDAWREGISGAFVPLAPEPLGAGRFEGSFQQIRRGQLTLARIEGTAQRVRRGTREIAATRGDVAYLNIQLSGQGQVRGGGGVRATAPGSGALVLAEHLFELEFTGPFQQLCVAMPVDWLRDRLQLPLGVVATRNLDLLRGGGRVVKAALSALIEARDAAEATQCGDLFASALDHSLRAHAPPEAGSGPPLRHAIARLVTQRFADERLTPASAAAALGCSVRTLHAACQREGRSFGGMLRDARLDAAERALRSTVLAGQVGPIAFACGFTDLSHFSRAFRARFGSSPSSYRGPPPR